MELVITIVLAIGVILKGLVGIITDILDALGK